MKIGRKIIASLVGTAVAMVLQGCVQNGGTTVYQESAYAPVVDNTHPRARLVYGSQNLAGSLKIDEARLRELGQLTQAQVTVKNKTENRYTLEYKFDWQDDQGFAVDSNRTWHRFTVAPREMQTFSSTGKTPEASKIVFTIRLPDDAFIENYRQRRYEQPYETGVE